MSDGNLRQLFAKHLPDAMWVPVETWSTGQGVPDVHYVFPGGASGWIENKLTTANAVVISPHQIAWLERYSRKGGRCFVAIRRKTKAGPRKGPARDELFIYSGIDARFCNTLSIVITPRFTQRNGPAKWDWTYIKKILCGTT